MMRSRPLLFGIAILSLVILSSPASLSAKDSVTWMEASMPPYFIKDGVNQDKGYGDEITDILQAHLPDYTHHQVTTNITRHFYKFKQGEKVCSAGLYRTPEREEFMYFSIPSFLTLPAVIVIKKENFPAFGNRTSVQLSEILNNQKLMFGFSKDRSFGTTLDAILDQHKKKKNIVEISGPELSLNLFKMLIIGRLDGLIGLPEEELYQAEQMGIRDQLMTITIEENQQGYEGWYSSVGCSKNAWGKQIIDAINKILLEQRPTQPYRAAYERWLDPNSIENYREIYTEVFLKTTP
jgi:uncharacterized protein (TIGR02285 family)